ncbi:protein DBF4 homolog A-like [Lepeophtheirus salmonis]|uniref:protein DBF4 homolog A-like n=1 Tax=Lepeophtheirus salmonis TaxID=72036 RepID=UPI001AE2826C|nr:protein DBF4 homolog B-like [Lepeophtheirus salmonis]
MSPSSPSAGNNINLSRKTALCDKDKYSGFSRPLLKHQRFYLDIRIRTSILKKLISDINSLGGAIDDFFSKDITTVISDAPDLKLRILSSSSPSSTVSPSAPQQGTCSSSCIPRTRSRVDTLLERARAVRKSYSCDVLDYALKWGLKIWNLDKVLIWIESVKCQSIFKRRDFGQSLSPTEVTHSFKLRLLKSPFIKLEAFSLRPLLLEFGGGLSHTSFPPIITWTGRLGASPFIIKESKKINESVKVTTRLPLKRNKSGFCEICEKGYSSLKEHLNSVPHRNRIEDSSFWTSLNTNVTHLII